MLGIHMGAEPPELRRYRESTPAASYAGAPKAPVRAALHRDQGELCAYCMRRIHDHPTEERQVDLSIEHWSAQSTDGGRDIHWPDLLAVCEGKIDGQLICDKARGNAPLQVHPVRDALGLEDRCRYLGDGRLEIDRADGDVLTLKLDNPRLMQNRAQVLNLLLAQSRGADLSRLRELLTHWEGRSADGLRREYAGVALYILRRAIRAREGRSTRTRGARSSPTKA